MALSKRERDEAGAEAFALGSLRFKPVVQAIEPLTKLNSAAVLSEGGSCCN